MLLQILLWLSLGIALTTANTEKTIFLGPESVNIPSHSSSLAALNIDTLTPANYSLRTHIDAIFPTQELARGKETWLILDNLTEGQRYEVRVCWLATQPTAFHLTTYPLETVFDTPALITSLYNYSMSRQQQQHSSTSSPPSTASASSAPEHQASILFLHISAAAEYFTTNATLMARPEPVLVDIILDPFVGNLLPRTLVPTMGYILAVAAGSWVLARWVVVPGLKGLFVDENGVKKTQ